MGGFIIHYELRTPNGETIDKEMKVNAGDKERALEFAAHVLEDEHPEDSQLLVLEVVGTYTD